MQQFIDIYNILKLYFAVVQKMFQQTESYTQKCKIKLPALSVFALELMYMLLK